MRLFRFRERLRGLLLGLLCGEYLNRLLADLDVIDECAVAKSSYTGRTGVCLRVSFAIEDRIGPSNCGWLAGGGQIGWPKAL
jgi:hypothetical protein